MKNNSEKSQKIDQIMEINVNSRTTVSLLTRVEDFISDSVKFYIVTPNPELVLMAQKNKRLKNALNAATLSIPDGIGLSQASKYFSLRLPKNFISRIFVGFFQGLRVGAATFLDKDWLTKEIKPIKGRELFMDLIKLAVKNDWKVFLLGGLDNEAELASRELQITNSKQFSNHKLQIEFDPGPRLNNNARPLTKNDAEIEKRAIDRINKFSPQLLFVAFGNPRQEIWIHEHLLSLKIGGAMCVGGTLRYIAGVSPLPPKWMAGIGLEWLYRLITEPKRMGRIFRAVIIFPLKVFLYKLLK